MLAPCPDSPNCVSSRDDDPDRRIAPLAVRGDPFEVMARVKRIVTAMPRTQVVDEQPGYLHVEFTSRIFGFVDDVEFALDEQAGVVHVRSASRSGYWDFGVNRRRVEDIRERLRRAGETGSDSG